GIASTIYWQIIRRIKHGIVIAFKEKLLDLLDALAQPDFDSTLQQIKQLFFERNYNAVFDASDNLPVYCARYTPVRSLCYYRLLTREPLLLSLLSKKTNIYCVG